MAERMFPTKNIKFISLLFCGFAALALTACSDFPIRSEINALKTVEHVGNTFTRQLALEYERFSTNESDVMFDDKDARHFAKKGLDSARGRLVMPEPLDNWDLTPAHMRELGTARGRLIMAFDMGAREIAPREAAIAQARFDCWIEQQEENWQAVDILSCKSQYMQAMNILELAIAPPPSTPPIPAAPVENMANMAHTDVVMRPTDSMFIVFFGFNKNKIGPSGEGVLDAIATKLRRSPGTVAQITGFTDRAGGENYNINLGQKRADAVKRALLKRGIDPRYLKATSKGEHATLVRTADNVKEPANRRVEIRFE